MTADQIQASFATSWTKAQYIQAAKAYYSINHPNWAAYLIAIGTNSSRFTLGEVKPCAALYRETGDTQYSDAIRAILIGIANNPSTMQYQEELDFNYSYYQVRDSASFSASDRSAIESFISQRMTWLMTQNSNTSFVRGMANAAALAYAERLLLPNDSSAPAWRAWHQAKWAAGMARTGDATEDASNYGPMWLQSLYEYLRVTGANLTDYFNQPAAKNFCERNLQVVSCMGFVPSYGEGASYASSGQCPGMFEALATIFRDGRYKAAAQRMFNFMRTVANPTWCGPTNDILAIPIFDCADDTVVPLLPTRPTVAGYTRTFADRTFPDKLVMESGTLAGDSSVLMNFTQGTIHGHCGGSAVVSFLDQGSPLLTNAAMANDSRVFHNLLMVRSAAEAFPFVPASASQLGQQYIVDNVRRRYVLNLHGNVSDIGGNYIDLATINALTLYLGGTLTGSSGAAFRVYFDNVQAVGASGTLVLSSSLALTNPGNWNSVSFGGARDLSAYDTVEFGMRIEQTDSAGAITALSVRTGDASGAVGLYNISSLDACSLGQAGEMQSFAKLQYASTHMSLKDTLGGNNLQERDLLLAPGGILLVRDQVTFPTAESGVQMGPIWNAAQLLASGTNWADLQQAKMSNLPQRNLLALFPARTDGAVGFATGTAQDSGSSTVVAYQKWSGNAAAGDTRAFNSLLIGHDPAVSATAVAATVQTLQCDETATVLRVGSNLLIINPGGAALNTGGVQTDARSLYMETNGNVVTYFAGTQGSSLVYSGSTLFAQGTRQARFGSSAPVLKVPAAMTVSAFGTAGAFVAFGVEAIDNNDGALTPVCTPASGSWYPVGTTTVVCSATNSMGISSTASFSVTVTNYGTQDIGAVGLTGSAASAGGVLQVTGAGADVFGAADAFRFVYRQVTGDCDIIAKVTGIQNTNGWAKVGVMVRETLDANAANAMLCLSYANGTEWQYRTATGANTGFVVPASADRAPYWVRVIRVGNVFTGYRSADGVAWVQAGSSQTIPMASPIYVGLAVTSHNATSLNTATFSNVTISDRQPPAIAVPSALTVAASGSDGAQVFFTTSAMDSLDGSVATVNTPASGSVFPIGTTTVSTTAADAGGYASSKTFKVTVTRSFAWFQGRYGLSGVSPAADAGQGVTYLTAYAFGLNPLMPDRSLLPSVVLANGCLQISYSRYTDASDLTYRVEVSGDLRQWNSGPGYTQQVSVTPIDASRQQTVEGDLIPIQNAGRRFIRIRIVK